MREAIGIIGVGHLAGYLVEGLVRVGHSSEIVLSPRNTQRSARLAGRYGATVAQDNQGVVDDTDLIILATRPNEVVGACQELAFRAEQIVISVAAGLPLKALSQAVAPAQAVRALPISCAAINHSPTLLYPDHTQVRTLFSNLGTVHTFTDEASFTAATTLSAFYGWIYALLGETVEWTIEAGVAPATARDLVLETARGAAGMAAAHPHQEVVSMLGTLATPGGITEYGLKILDQRQSLAAWREALTAVHERLSTNQPMTEE